MMTVRLFKGLKADGVL